MGITLKVLLILGALGVVVALVRARTRGQGQRAEEYHHFRCPGCRRRLRYQEHQVGNTGKCSNCGRDLIFPPLSEALD